MTVQIDRGVLESSSLARLATILLLYVGQGIPIGLFDFVVPAWLAANGASAADIAFVVAMTGAPWSLKFIAGFIMDRYTFFAMGRRRSWILGAQVVMIACLFAVAAIAPTPDQILLIGTAALIVNTATVFQDVAADGLTVDILPEQERGVGSGLASGGHTLGIAMASAVAGIVLYAFGISAAYFVAGILLSVITAEVLWTREREGERRFPWSIGEANPRSLAFSTRNWLPLVKATLANTLAPISLIWLVVLVVRGLSYGMLVIAVPLMAAQGPGWSESELSSANGTAQLVGGLLAILIGGVAVSRIGARQSLIGLQCVFIVVLAAMIWQSPNWIDERLLIAFIFGWIALDSFLGVGATVINMRLSPPEISATQFSIYMALKNQGTTLAGVLVASIAVLAAPVAMLYLLIGAQVLALGILVFTPLPRRQLGKSTSGEALPA